MRLGDVALMVGAGFDLAKIIEPVLPDEYKSLASAVTFLLKIKSGDSLVMKNVVKFCKPKNCTTHEELGDQLVGGVDEALKALGLFSADSSDLVGSIVSSIPGTIGMSSCDGSVSSGSYKVSIKSLAASLALKGDAARAALAKSLKDETCAGCFADQKCPISGGSGGGGKKGGSGAGALSVSVAALAAAASLAIFSSKLNII